MKVIPRPGFTLVEVVLSLVILTAGIAAVYRPLISGMSSMNYLGQRMEAEQILVQKIWEFDLQANTMGGLLQKTNRDVVTSRTKTYTVKLSAEPHPAFQQLQTVEGTVFWQAGNRSRSLRRTAYIWIPEKDAA